MFSGFTDQTSEFFWELGFNNERPWFMAHKEQFEREVNAPFKALAAETFAVMRERYPQKELLLHTARIYRDARRLHGGGPYKDHLWFSIKADQGLLSGPMFWFEFGARDYSFGMGFYDMKSADCAAFRRTVDANPARFERIVRDIADCVEFRISGAEYKRPFPCAHGEPISQWYNRRQVGADCRRDFGGLLLESSLPTYLADEYEKLMPLYEFLNEILLSE